jgi:hypothetical protein
MATTLAAIVKIVNEMVGNKIFVGQREKINRSIVVILTYI